MASPLPSGLLSLAAAALLAIAQPAPAYRILFIGNSLTYSNDLPAMVCALARGSDETPCAGVAKPDYSLEDHWNGARCEARDRARMGYRHSPAGPSALPDSRVLLVSMRSDSTADRKAARTAFYMGGRRDRGAVT